MGRGKSRAFGGVSDHVEEDEVEARPPVVGDLDVPAVDAHDLLDGGKADAGLSSGARHERQEYALRPGGVYPGAVVPHDELVSPRAVPAVVLDVDGGLLGGVVLDGVVDEVAEELVHVGRAGLDPAEVAVGAYLDV